MTNRAKALIGIVAGSLALAGTAASASAAPVTVSTNAGTTCTINAAKTVGPGLLALPVSFSGTIDCSLANSANAPSQDGGLVLSSRAPLGLGMAGGTPTTPADQRSVITGPESSTFRCEVSPDADCDFAGSSFGLQGQTYQVFFGSTLTAPAGETWTTAPAGNCTIVEAGASVACNSSTEPFVIG